jgi:hypothetical protein
MPAAGLLGRAWKDKSSKMLRAMGEDKVAASKAAHSSGWFAACRSGDLVGMEAILDDPDAAIDVDYTDDGGHTGFFLACLEEQFRAARLLKNRGANTEFADSSGTTPFWAACEAGHLGIVKFLHEQCQVQTEKPIANGATPLHAACHQGNVDVIKYLVEQVGVDVLVQARNGATPFFIACYAGELDVARYLGDLQVDMHVCAANGTSPRDVADRFNHFPVCQYVDRAMGSSLTRPVRACMTNYLAQLQERGDGNCQLRTHTADMVQAAVSYRHVIMTDVHKAAHATMCYLLPICVRIVGKRQGKKLWKSFQGLQSVEHESAGQGFLKDMAPGSGYRSMFGEGSGASTHVAQAADGKFQPVACDDISNFGICEGSTQPRVFSHACQACRLTDLTLQILHQAKKSMGGTRRMLARLRL